MRQEVDPSAPPTTVRVLVERGKIIEDMREQAQKIMRGNKIILCVDLGIGEASARSFGCDLSPKYVDINASYTT